MDEEKAAKLEELAAELVKQVGFTPQLNFLGAMEILRKHGVKSPHKIALDLMTYITLKSQVSYDVEEVDDMAAESLTEEIKKFLQEAKIDGSG